MVAVVPLFANVMVDKLSVTNVDADDLRHGAKEMISTKAKS